MFLKKKRQNNPWPPPPHTFTCGLKKEKRKERENFKRKNERWFHTLKKNTNPCLYMHLMKSEEKENS